MKQKKAVKKLLKDLRKLHTDMKEVKVVADIQYQTDRLGEIIETAETNIHGGGTGDD